MLFPTFSNIGAFFSLILAIYILIKDWRAFVHRIFALGMIVLGLEAGFGSFSLSTTSAEEIFKWELLRITIASFLPGIWLIFALSLGQENYKENIKKWRWVLLPIFLTPLALAIIFKNEFFINGASAPIISKGLLPIGWPGKLFHIVFLFSAVLILACLERTLRATSGVRRWQIKFMILGVASIFALRIYTSSQVLLYSMLDVSDNGINTFGLIAGNTLMAISFVRMPKIILTIYPSQSFLYNSAIILIIGVYLIIVGFLAKIIHYFGYTQIFPLSFLFIFLAITLLAIFVLSEKVRQKIREFISRHLARPRYDYREQWREFTKRTSSIIDIEQLSKAVTNFIADTFGVSTASIWLLDDKKGGFRLSGSTAYSFADSPFLLIPEKEGSNFLGVLKNANLIDFQNAEDLAIDKFKKINEQFFPGNRIRYGIPLVINENILGFITINEKVTKNEFTIEDFDLLKTISDQVAAALLNLKLSEQLRDLKELEAFRTMSSFIMHDLKNVASTLSLTMQNLPIHFGNPDFRQDAVRVTNESLAKINNLCAGLSALSQKIEIKRVKTNIQELILNIFSYLNIIPSPLREEGEGVGGALREAKIYEWKANNNNRDITIIYDAQIKSTPFLDPEEIQKVIMNLLLNARDALRDGGEIKVATRQNENWFEISISDNGCGMSKEFIEKSLFRPFKTTKKKGMGIGLFQSKMIIEAHGGKMEAESEENVGTTFRIKLPI